MARKKTDSGEFNPAVPDEQPASGNAGELTPAPYGTARPAGKGALPRIVDQLARAGKDETRFKVACRNHEGCEPLYVLAADGDEDSARDHYLQACGLSDKLDRLKKAGVKIDEPVLAVRALDD